ncbi:WD40 repeat domain-containing serine/threonine protein kinase [Streptosporangium jomthongense]|uniref:WD40 repeat domain-containing serine/threonine protein kinase n=1 Tax=Streptosporangium jomthongense TaxID=1193683 RepID=A0ABV8F3J3_9ACTN
MSTGLVDGDPQRLGGYWLAGRLGAGGQGVVYEAYDARGERVAVKVLHGDAAADPELRERFGREAASARRIASFCTAAVVDADLEGPRPYIVSEYVEGPSLRRAVVDGRRFTGGDLHRLATAVATALTAIHEAGVIHRDLKPDNVLLGPDGPRVIDFGVARMADMSLTATGMVAGTPTYMAPEIFMGERATEAVDVFAWGGVMVFAATGLDPFRAESLGGVMHRVLSVQPQLDVLPEQLRPLVAASLAKDPTARPAARELLLALISGGGSLDTRRLLAAGSETGGRMHTGSNDPALGDLAEEAFGALGQAEREIAPEVFLRLVTVTDDGELTVRRAQLAELLQGRGEEEIAAVHRVLAAFTYLVGRDEQALWLSRPALTQAWPRLRQWVGANRDGLVVHRHILTAAWRWQSQGRRDGDLFQGSNLENAMNWAATGRRNITLSPVERDFLEAGAALARRRARRGRLLSVTLAGLLAVALAAGVLAVQQGRVAEARSVTIAHQRDQAQARQLAATAESLRVSEPVRAMLLSVAAWRLNPVVEARAALTGSLAQRETAAFHDPAAGVHTLRALSRDGRVLVSAGDGQARVWDVRTGGRAGGFDGIGDELTGIALSPSGRLLAVVSGTKLTIWDMTTGKPTGATLTVRGRGVDGISQVTFGRSEDLVLVSRGEGLMVWNRRTGGEAAPFTAGMGFDTSPDGTGLAVADLGGNATATTLADGRKVSLGQRCTCVRRVAYSPDGKVVAVRTGALIRLHDASTGADLQRSFTDADVQRSFDEGDADTLVFSPDGRFLASVSERNIRLWRVADGALLFTHAVAAFRPVAAFDPDGRTLRYLSEDSVTSLDIAFATAPAPLGKAGFARAALSPDGRLLASKGEGPGKVVLWDVRGRRSPAALDVGSQDPGGYFEMAFSGDGRRLAVVTGDMAGEVQIWDARTFEKVMTVTAPRQGNVTAIAVNADGTALAGYVAYPDSPTGDGGEIHLWDVPGGRHRWARKQGYPDGLRFAPDGRALAVAGGEQRLLDTRTGKPFGPSYGSPTVGVPVLSLAFGGDGSRFAIADQAGRLSVWETSSRKQVGETVRTGAGETPLLTYSPRGDVIAGRVDGGSVALWDVETGRRLGAPIATGPGEPKALAFTGDGTRLVVADSSGVLAEHPVEPEAVANAVCARAGRTLSAQEWRTYLGETPYRDVCPR